MSRKSGEKCCICLKPRENLSKLTETNDRNISILTKLKACIPDISWVQEYLICIPCTDLLNVAYVFRENCLKAELVRKEKREKLEKFEDYLEDDSDDESADATNDDLIFPKSTKSKKKSETTAKRKKLNYKCHLCNDEFFVSTRLVEHCVEKHGMNVKDIKPFACDRCPLRFSTASNLHQHIQFHDGIRSSICSYCGKGFVTKNDLINHEKKHLNKREYKCDLCGKGFNTHKNARSHKLAVHTDSSEWKYKCSLCDKPFPIKSNCDNHLRRHIGDKRFECHLCDKKFASKCDLQRHVKSHSVVREHKCLHCKKEYKDERVLKIHMAKVHGIGLGEVKIPVQEKKHVCPTCSKAYRRKNALTRHLYTHSSENPLACPICQKTFTDKTYVNQHIKNTHHPEFAMFDCIDSPITENLEDLELDELDVWNGSNHILDSCLQLD